MLDTLVTGGLLVTAEGASHRDVGIRGERFAIVAAPGSLDGSAARTVDASGQLVIPGGIDPNVHTNWRQVRPSGELFVSGSPARVTRAALFGGTTTVIGFAPTQEGMGVPEAVDREEQSWRESYTDYSLHVLLRGAVTQEILDQIPEAVAAGFPSLKLFTTDVVPYKRGLKVEMHRVCAVVERVARHGGILAVHAEDDDLLIYMRERLRREGTIGFEMLPLVHSSISEGLAFRRILRFARSVEGAALYLLHASAREGVDAIAEARSEGLAVYGETLHNFATFTADDYRRPDGVLFHTYPSLKSEEDRERLWSGLREGALNTIATDQVSTPRAIKLEGTTIFNAVGGHAGVETRLAVAYTEGVCRRGLSLERFVAITSTNAARIFGLYPRKGAIAPGSDADLVIFDPNVRRTLQAEGLHDVDFSVWDGYEVRGWPSLVILRGEVMVDRGQMRGQPGRGCRVSRRLSPPILSGPAVS